MKTQPFYYEILAVLFLSVIPWPGPSVFKISCSRDRASVVRRIVQKRWIPILKKYQVELPLECPFHESRDIFYPQQAAKHQHRSSQWTCGLCGKSFYTENHLDTHFDNRHKTSINTAEDAVCLADYCDIMRCDVLGSRDLDSSLVDGTSPLNTDIQVWKENTENKASSTACETRENSRICRGEQSHAISDGSSSSFASLQRYCQHDNSLSESHYSADSHRTEVAGPDNKSSACKGAAGDEEDEEHEEDDAIDDDEEEGGNLVEATLPATSKKRRGKAYQLRKLKARCKPEELQKLKLQCEILVRDCIAGLLANLSLRDFQEVESELNRAICWYLSCDRYWEDTKRQQLHTPWYLLITFLILLSASVFGCYYIVWIVFNSAEDPRIDSEGRNMEYNHSTDLATSHYHESSIHSSGRLDDRRKAEVIDESLAGSGEDSPDHYIYVAYPPELKRRLMESCYNRTTRL